MKSRAFTAVILLVSLTSLHARSRQQIFSARANTVRVDALVTENGKPVGGLTAADFEILDNGVAQDLSLISGDDASLGLVLALDMSQSVEGDRRENLQRAGLELLSALRVDDRAGLLTFSGRVAQQSAPTLERKPLRDALGTLHIASGGTSLIDASYAGLVLADSGAGRSLLLVFSDGVETSSWLEAPDVLNSARASNVVVYSVMVKAPGASSFLPDLGATTGGRVIQIESTTNLSAVFSGILDEFRQRYVLGYTPKGVAPSGYHKIEVRVKRRGATITARRGYQGAS